MKREVTIDGTVYAPKPEPTDLQIVMVDNHGLTFVGNCIAITDTAMHVIRDARCVIRWGTTQHLSELAAHGPTENTRLSTVPRDVRVSEVVLVYDCDREAWHGK